MKIEVDTQEYIKESVNNLEQRILIKMGAIETALELQADKNEKHFNALNNEQARLLSDRERFLPRETYAADRKDKMAAMLSVVSLIVSIILFLVNSVLNANGIG